MDSLKLNWTVSNHYVMGLWNFTFIFWHIQSLHQPALSFTTPPPHPNLPSFWVEDLLACDLIKCINRLYLFFLAEIRICEEGSLRSPQFWALCLFVRMSYLAGRCFFFFFFFLNVSSVIFLHFAFGSKAKETNLNQLEISEWIPIRSWSSKNTPGSNDKIYSIFSLKVKYLHFLFWSLFLLGLPGNI